MARRTTWTPRELPTIQSADHSQRSRDFAVSSPVVGAETLLADLHELNVTLDGHSSATLPDLTHGVQDEYTDAYPSCAHSALASFAAGAVPSVPVYASDQVGDAGLTLNELLWYI